MGPVSDLAIAGVSIIALVMGLVELSKKLGVAGNWLIVEGFVIGVALAALAAAVSEGLIPVVALPWVRVGVLALAGGVVAGAACGHYDLIFKKGGVPRGNADAGGRVAAARQGG